MFTEKQADKLAEFFERNPPEKLLQELDTLPIPKLEFPEWIPSENVASILGHLEILQSHQNSTSRVFFDHYNYGIIRINHIYPAFTSPQLQKHWGTLQGLSKRKTIKFGHLLSRLYNEFDRLARLITKHRDEIASGKRMVAKARSLLEAMDEYHCHYYGHFLADNHNEFIESVMGFIDFTEEGIAELQAAVSDIPKQYGSNGLLTRQFQSKEARQLFYARSINRFFVREFGQPMHDCVADFVNVIFGTTYTDNDIIKAVRVTKPSPKVKTRRGK